MFAKKTAHDESQKTSGESAAADGKSADGGSTDSAEASNSKASDAKAAESKPVAKSSSTKAAPEEKPRKSRDTGKKLLAGANALRDRIASVVWLIAVVFALILATAALLVALKANSGNAIVSFVKDAANALDLGVFSPKHGLFTPKKDPNLIKASLINWGIGAIAYLVVGKLLDRTIRS